MKNAVKDFKAFILRGNVIDLAVGVAIGAAFATVVTSFTKNLLTPILAIPGDQASFAALDFSIRKATFRYGAFIDDVIGFVLIAAALFFLVIRPINTLMARRKTEPDVHVDHPGLPLLPVVDSHRRQPVRLLHGGRGQRLTSRVSFIGALNRSSRRR